MRSAAVGVGDHRAVIIVNYKSLCFYCLVTSYKDHYALIFGGAGHLRVSN